MFEMMLLKISEVQTKLNDIESKQAALTLQSDKHDVACKMLSGKIKNAKAEMATVTCKLEQITDVVTRNEHDIRLAKERAERIEIKVNKGTLMISGIEERKDENLKEIIKNFFTQKMEITGEIEIQTTFRIGKGNDRTIVVKLYDQNDLGRIFGSISNLKEKTNSKEKSYYVNEQLTEKQSEERKRRREIKAVNRSLPISHQKTVTHIKGELLINNERYRKQVPPPNAETILKATASERTEFEGIPIIEGAQMEQQGSRFIAYGVRAYNFNTVREAYKCVKSKHLRANHVICGYCIFGPDFPKLQDYSDDGEYSAGRHILNVLQSDNIFNIAVFVVRYFGDVHIGKDRFKIIEDLTADVITKMPGALDYGQGVANTELLEALQNIPPLVGKKKQDDQPDTDTANRGKNYNQRRGNRGGRGQGN